ncbi:MAG TPA: transketolase C-terminal domain-containing protein [Chloroflexota bacterium]|nr:transketolase C-terminal domain-containing protein [Chloroflexota bacterium]
MTTRETQNSLKAVGEAMVALGEQRDEVVVCISDTLKTMGMDIFRSRFPDRLLDFGIGEQDAVMAAAGMATCGKIPFMASYAVFLSMRTLEQIRTFISYPRLNVKILAGLGAYSAGVLGVTHAATEDLSILRAIPGMTVICPADAAGIRAAVFAAAEHQGPVYIRLGMAVPKVHGPDYKFEIGKAVRMRTEGQDAGIIANGIMLSRALDAAEQLSTEGIHVQVSEFHTLKPIDRGEIIRLARETGALVTAEENNIIGGLGGAVAEVLAEEVPTPLERVGIPDRFADTGSQDELLEDFGLTVDAIVQAVRHAMSRKLQDVATR